MCVRTFPRAYTKIQQLTGVQTRCRLGADKRQTKADWRRIPGQGRLELPCPSMLHVSRAATPMQTSCSRNCPSPGACLQASHVGTMFKELLGTVIDGMVVKQTRPTIVLPNLRLRTSCGRGMRPTGDPTPSSGQILRVPAANSQRNLTTVFVCRALVPSSFPSPFNNVEWCSGSWVAAGWKNSSHRAKHNSDPKNSNYDRAKNNSHRAEHNYDGAIALSFNFAEGGGKGRSEARNGL